MSTARLTNSVNTTSCSKDTVTDGTAWADWTICCVEQKSMSEPRRVPADENQRFHCFQRNAATVLIRLSEQTDPCGGLIAAHKFVLPTPVSSLSLQATGSTMLQ